MKRYFYIITILTGVVIYIWVSLLVALIVVFVLCLVMLAMFGDAEESSKQSDRSTYNYNSKYRGNQQKSNGQAEATMRFIDRAIVERNGFVNSNDLLSMFGLKNRSDIDKTLYKAHLDKLIQGLHRLGYGIVPNY